MAATVTLSTTTLVDPVDSSARSINVASTTGIIPGKRLWVDRELMAVIRLGVNTNVDVQRGVDGTPSMPHSSSASVVIGDPHEFYEHDPVGTPELAVLVSPYINVRTGDTWLAQGDELPNQKRWWEKVTLERAIGALGVRTETSSPTSEV